MEEQVELKNQESTHVNADKLQLEKRRKMLLTKLKLWNRGLNWKRIPTQENFHELTDELLVIEQELMLDESALNESNEMVNKILKVANYPAFTIPFGALNKTAESSAQKKEKKISKSSESNLIDNIIDSEKEAKVLQATISESESDEEVLIKITEGILPKFDGKVISWLRFWPKFEILVHNNKRISIVEKVIRLEQCMDGEAKQFVYNIQPTSESYKGVIAELKQKFDNPDVQQAAFESEISSLKKIDDRYNVEQLRKLLLSSQMILQQAKLLQFQPAYINGQLIVMIKRLLPEEFQNSINVIRPRPKTFDEFIEAFRIQIEGSEQFLADNGPRKQQSKQWRPNYEFKRFTRANTATTSNVSDEAETCLFCESADHRTPRCNLNDEAKEQVIRKQQLCFACLQSGHLAKDCTNDLCCRRCNGNHWGFLCRINHRGRSTRSNEHPPNEAPEETQARSCKTGTALYQTCLAKANNQVVRVGFDTGAGHSFITTDLANQLRLQVKTAPAIGIKRHGDHYPSSFNNRIATVWLSSIDNQGVTKINARVIDDLGDTYWQAAPMAIVTKAKSMGINFRDDGRKPVQILLGVRHYAKLATGNEVKLTQDFLAKSSKIGWLVFGGSEEVVGANQIVINQVHTESIAKEVIDETNFNELFKKSCITFNGERYVVNFPWLEPIDLERNEEIAKARARQNLIQLDKRHLLQQYKEQFDEMIERGFAEKVNRSDLIGRVYFMPHSGVWREDKITSKLRIVHDASSSKVENKSLNANLYKSTTTWNSIESLLRFRVGRFAAIADIEKAYMMIELADEDRNATAFVWPENRDEFTYYRMTRVPFGTAASPFLLFITMEKHFDTCPTRFQDIVEPLRRSFYVDDCLISTDSLEEMENFHYKSIEFMKMAGMNLRKWRVNDTTLDLKWRTSDEEKTKVLGTLWNLQEDKIYLNINLSPKIETKRQLASIIASIFDPLGMVLPVTVAFKLLLQEVWLNQSDWDDRIPDRIIFQVRKLTQELSKLEKVNVPRWLGTKTNQPITTIHLVTDASTNALGAVAYICTNNNKPVFVQAVSQLVRKRKVAEKTVPHDDDERTVPDLELKALLLAAKLYQRVIAILPCDKVVVWSDSMITVARMCKAINQLSPKIVNRVWNIKQALPANEYRWLPTSSNVADLLTRGVTVTKLLERDDWITGPHELSTYQPSNASIVHIQSISFESIPADLIEIFNDKPTLEQCFEATNQITEENRLLHLLKMSQTYRFSEEIRATTTQRPVSPKSLIRNIPVFLDERGLLRVKSRLTRSTVLDEESKFPIILDPTCGLTWALATDAHQRVGHLATSTTLAELRSQYYIPRGRQLVSRIISACQPCIIERRKFMNPEPAALPQFRVDPPSRAFTNIGIDFFGPLIVNVVPKAKYYGLIISCANSRAIDLELCLSEDTKAVFDSLMLVFARHGVPSFIYSDNGTSFGSTNRALQELARICSNLKEHSFFRMKPIEWQFQTPASPWKGGSFERIIGTVKRCLRGLTFRKTFSIQSLRIILAQVANILNNRPLFTLNDTIVTPNHFICGERMPSIPPIGSGIRSQNDIVRNYISHQRRLNGLWTSLLTHYLGQLPSVHKYPPSTPTDLKIGDIVLVPMHSRRRDDWPIAKIIRIFPSMDNVPRSVEVQFKNGNTLHRSTARLVHLEHAPDPFPPAPAMPGREDVAKRL